jgi:GNAT superfamily N-acetyltransferase
MEPYPMADLLVKLYQLPELAPLLKDLEQQGIEIYRSIPSHKRLVVEWCSQYFPGTWPMEVAAAFEQRPLSCFSAVQRLPDPLPKESPYDLSPELFLGFAVYDVVARGMFGPTGVREDYRRRGIGKALLLACLHAMRDEGYAYAIIGWAGPVDFYARAVGATIIEGSEPGIFRALPRLD